jgi:hypothetical protein
MDWLETLYEDIAEPLASKYINKDDKKSSSENDANVKAYNDIQQNKATSSVTPTQMPFGLTNNQVLIIGGGVALISILLLRGK